MINPYQAPVTSEVVVAKESPARSTRVLGLFAATAVGVLIGHLCGDVLLCRSFVGPRALEAFPTAILLSPFTIPIASWGIQECVPFAPVGVLAGAGWLFWPVYALLVFRWLRAASIGPTLIVATSLWVAQGFFCIVGKFEALMSV